VRELAAALRAGEPPGPGLELDPPLPAPAVAAALGLPDPVACTVDVHQSSWVLAVAVAGRAERVRLGGFELEARLDGAAAGPPRPDVTAPAAAVRDLADTDEIRALRIRGA
jgi:hypothetical protein